MSRLDRKKLFAFHGWLGLNLGLPLFIICLSGTFAVMSPEIDWLINPAMRASPPDKEAQPLSWGTLIDRIEEKYPSGTVAFIHVGTDRRSAYQASVAFSPRDQRLVFIDPYSGEVKGQSTLFNVKGFFRIFHKQFYILSGDYWPHGRVLVCAFSLVLLFSAITGLLFYKRWWRSLWTLRLGRGRRVFWSDLHRFVGVWALLFALMFAVTGLWYLTARILEDFDLLEHDSFASLSRETLAERSPNLEPAPIDDLVAKAETAYPEFRITGVFPNARPGSGVTLIGQGPAMLVSESANQVHLDPYSGDILKIAKAHELPLGARLIETVDPLHFGRFGGFSTKIIWTVAGLALSIGILAGVYIWWLRVSRNSAGFFKKNRGWTAASLVFNLALFGLAIVSSIAFIGNQISGPRTSEPGYSLGQKEIGPWRIEAFRHGESFTFRFASDGHPNFRSAYAWAGESARPDNLKPLRGTVSTLFVQPAADTLDNKLNLRIENWRGETFASTFPLVPVAYTPSERASPPAAPPVPYGVWAMVALFVASGGIPLVVWLVRVH